MSNMNPSGVKILVYRVNDPDCSITKDPFDVTEYAKDPFDITEYAKDPFDVTEYAKVSQVFQLREKLA